jgi:hypothetical protein
MKVIFLDHDGVICLSSEWGTRHKKQEKARRKLSQSIMSLPVLSRYDDFNKEAVKVLNEILEETGAEIVVSSDWKRWADVKEMGEYYLSQGIIKKPIGFTPYCSDLQRESRIPDYDNFKWTRSDALEQERHFEILDWLSRHPEVTHWVAVDDLFMGIHVEHSGYGPYDREWGLQNFVWTPYQDEGIKAHGTKEIIMNFF